MLHVASVTWREGGRFRSMNYRRVNTHASRVKRVHTGLVYVLIPVDLILIHFKVIELTWLLCDLFALKMHQNAGFGICFSPIFFGGLICAFGPYITRYSQYYRPPNVDSCASGTVTSCHTKLDPIPVFVTCGAIWFAIV